MLEKLTGKDREFVKSQVDFGYYASEIEVVRDAVRRLREKTEENKINHLRALAFKGHAQLLNGEGETLTNDLMDDIAKAAKKQVKEGLPIKHDVKP